VTAAERDEAFADEWVRRTAGADGVVFDFGGVISVAPDTDDWPVYDYCAVRGVDRAAFRAGWCNYRHLYDGGFIAFEEMYRRIFADAHAEPPTRDDLDAIWHLDIESWIGKLRSDTLALMRRIKSEGRKVGILTNMSPDFYERLFVPRASAYRLLADAEVVSGIERLYKPQPEIYALMALRLGLLPEKLFFLDDLERNVDAARTCGWRAEVYPPPA
jgi:HAD superfamily hydrolase (TIGR01509 family)